MTKLLKLFPMHDKRRVILPLMVLIIIATGFNAFLSTLTFKNNYVESIISQYIVMGNVLTRKIELSLHFGKKIDNFLGMETLLKLNLEHITRMNPDPSESTGLGILVCDTKGEILHATDETLKSTVISQEIISELDNDSATPFYIKHNQYHILIPIKNWDHSIAGALVILFPETTISHYLSKILKKSLGSWLWILLASAGMVLLLFYITSRRSKNTGLQGSPSFRTKTFTYSLFSIIVLCQMIFSLSQFKLFTRQYITINQTKADALNLFLKYQVEPLLNKGIDLKNLNMAEQFIGSMISENPEFSSIAIFDLDGSILYHADQNIELNHMNPEIRSVPTNAPGELLRREILLKDGVKAGTISVLISKTALASFQKKILMDTSTTILISIFFCVEIMILFFTGISRTERAGKNRISTRIMRPVAFIQFFAIDSVVSFIPLYMKKLYAGFPEFLISENMTMGLPVTVQMISTAVAILIVGSWCDKKGWQQPFFYGLVFSSMGFFLAFITRTPLLFLFSIAGAGFGYGLSYISAQHFVISNLAPEEKAKGLSEYYAGCIAGSICGIATGGMLAEQIGFSNVFLMGFFILAGVSVWAAFILKPYFVRPIPPLPLSPRSRKFPLAGFFLDRKMFFILYLNIIPAAIVLVGFMNYFIPVYLQENQIPQSDIGRVYMAFGICLIYIGPFITHLINIQKHSVSCITLGGILGGMALLTFIFFSGYSAVILSIIFLGLGATFNAVRNAWALNLDISRKIGEGRTSSLIFFHARLGQALGPLVFAWFAVGGKDSSGIITIGVLFLALSIIFLLLNLFSTRNQTQIDQKTT